jgi:hypothetical protein
MESGEPVIKLFTTETTSTVPVAANVTEVAVPEMNAPTVFTPVTVPNVHDATEATPLIPVVIVYTLNEPFVLVTPTPEVTGAATLNVTVAPETVLPKASKTVTENGPTEVATVAEPAGTTFCTIRTGEPCVPEAVNVANVDVPEM